MRKGVNGVVGKKADFAMRKGDFLVFAIFIWKYCRIFVHVYNYIKTIKENIGSKKL